MNRRLTAIAVTIATMGGLGLAPAAHADSPTCSTFLIVGARGTDEEPKTEGGVPALPSEYPTALYGGAGVLAATIYGVLEPIVANNSSTIDFYGVRYPAALQGGLWGAGGTWDEIFQRGTYSPEIENNWRDGVEIGVEDAVDAIEDVHSECPDTMFILVGYSQGADVIAETIGELGSTLRSRVVSTALFADPRFNPNDTATAKGSFEPNRIGMFGARAQWSTKLTSPVHSYCIFGDVSCQLRARDSNNNDDFVSFHYQNQMWQRYGDALGTHGHYQKVELRLARQAAYSIADDLQLSFTEDGPAVDVVFLVDTTVNTDSALTELQSRAAELTDAIEDVTPNAHFALVEYKGLVAPFDSPMTNVAQDLTDDPEDVLDAIDLLSSSGGTPVTHSTVTHTSVGYSGAIAAASLDMRPYARKLIVLLSGSRVNAEDPWYGHEEASPSLSMPTISYGYVASRFALQTDLRAYGVSVSDDWAAAGWVSRLTHGSAGAYATTNVSGSGVDKLLRLTDEGLRRIRARISGPQTGRTGETLEFNAGASFGIVADSDLTYVWSVCEVVEDEEEETMSRGSRSTTRSSSSAPEPCGLNSFDPPADDAYSEGDGQDSAEYEFDEPGVYSVGFYARVDPSDDPYWVGDPQLYWDGGGFEVRVEAAPTAAPARELLSRTLVGNTLTLRLEPDAGAPQAVDYWELKNPLGQTVERYVFPPEDRTLDVLDAGSSEWTLVPVNEFGATEPRMAATATSITVEYGTMSTDAVVELEGPLTEQIEDLALEFPTSTIPLDGTYSSIWSAGNWEVVYPMDGVDATLEVGASTWTARFEIGSDLDVDDSPIRELLDWGLGADLISGGTIEVQIDGEPVTFRVDSTTTGTEINLGVLDPEASPPDGVTMDIDSYTTDGTAIIEVHLDGAYDSQLFPAWDETVNPSSYDWSQAWITDVRAFIGTTEYYYFGGAVSINALSAPTSTGTGTIVLMIEGTPGIGSIALMREYLQSGTVAFRVNDGDYNVVKLEATSTEAEILVPDP